MDNCKYCIQINSSIGYRTEVYEDFEEAKKVFTAYTGVTVPENTGLQDGVKGSYYGDRVLLYKCSESSTEVSEPYCGIDMDEYYADMI